MQRALFIILIPQYAFFPRCAINICTKFFLERDAKCTSLEHASRMHRISFFLGGVSTSQMDTLAGKRRTVAQSAVRNRRGAATARKTGAASVTFSFT